MQHGAGGRWRGIAGRLGSRIGRPAGGLVTLVLVLGILAAPAYLYREELKTYALFGDDFIYISNVLDVPTLVDHLLKPHNTHVVPLWRIWNHLVVVASGPLERMPLVFGAAAYFGLAVAMVAVGLFAGKESGRTAIGLVAMAMVGVTTVNRSTLTWYSAGQALWAGTGVVVTLLAARRWARKGGVVAFVLLILSALAAALWWSGGLLAGPTAAAYLMAKRPPGRTRGALIALGVVAVASAAAIVVVSLPAMNQNKIVWETHKELWPRPIQAVFHTAQGTVEMVLIGGIGLDATTSPWQSALIVGGLLALWLRSKGGPGNVNPLEASGLVLLFGSYYLAYVFRGNLPFDNLREVTWYNAVPYMGATLFVAGLWQGLAPAQGGGGRLTLGQAGMVGGVVAVLLAIHAPREERLVIAEGPRLLPSEQLRFPIPELQRLRALYFREEHRDRQVRSLARLEKAKPVIDGLGVGRDDLRRIYGRIPFPGIPELQTHTDPFSMIRIPAGSRGAPGAPEVRQTLDIYLRPEPQPRPEWLTPSDPWPAK